MLLEREHSGVAGHRGRQEGLLALGVEVEFAPLHPEHAAAFADPVVRGQTDLVADLRVERADLAIALDLRVLVVVAGDAQAQRVHRARRGQPLRARVIAALRHVEPHIGRLETVVVVVVVMVVVAVGTGVVTVLVLMFVSVAMAETRQAVLGAVLADREAVLLTIADPGDAEAAAVGAAVGVGQAVARLVVRFALGLEVFFGRLGPGIARDAQLVAAAVMDVGVHLHPVAELACGMRADGAGVGGGVAAHLERRAEGLVERFDRDAPGDDVDRTRRGCIAEQQRRGTAHHLDALGEQRVERDRVVLGERRRVEHVGTVLEHLHAQTALAADHGPARDRSERGRRQAGLCGQRLGDGRRALPDQLVSAEHQHRLRGLELAAAQRRGGDAHLLEALDLHAVVGGRRLGGGERREGGEHGGRHTRGGGAAGGGRRAGGIGAQAHVRGSPSWVSGITL